MNWSVSAHGDASGCLILPLFSDVNPPLLASRGLDRASRPLTRKAIESDDWTGKSSQVLSIWTPNHSVILRGAGDRDKATEKSARDGGSEAMGALVKRHGKHITVRFTTGWSVALAAAFVEGMILRDYEFKRYKTDVGKDDEDEDEDDTPYTLGIQITQRHVDALETAVTRLAAVSSGNHLARDLANTPPADLYPEAYADQAVEWAKGKKNVSVAVIDWEALQAGGYGGHVGVGKGSSRKPRMVIFTLNAPSKGQGEPSVIVGKGITFDSGGLNIKTSMMEEMKYDMGGSAVVFGLMQSLVASGSKAHVVGIACLAENMPDGEAYRPSDVLTSYSGKTVEVLNTDAEGRLVLMDGLWKAGEYNPRYIIDLATLTGSIMVALGSAASGLWSNDDGLRYAIVEAGQAVDELAWPMPLLPVFEKQIKGSKIADVKNLGVRWGGANSAAAFLKQFVQSRGEGDEKKQIPWAHIDIAGTAWDVKENAQVAHGGTAVGVRMLAHLIDVMGH